MSTVFRRPIHAGFALLALALMFVAGCSHRAARVNTPLAPARIGSTEAGIASWYGVPYHGRRAASGEIYDMEQLTAAHRTLPFQTWVEVTNLSNGKQVDVRINDRGPFVKGRIVDLSQAAARDIDMLRAGTVRVRLKVIAPPRTNPGAPAEPVSVTAKSTSAPTPATPPGTDSTVCCLPPPSIPAPPAVVASAVGFAVQAGAFADRDRAESLRSTLEDGSTPVRVVPGTTGLPLWRVIVGREMTRDRATELAARVRQQTGAAVVVAEPEPSPTPAHE
jgi:rare lipoprotein A